MTVEASLIEARKLLCGAADTIANAQPKNPAALYVCGVIMVAADTAHAATQLIEKMRAELADAKCDDGCR